MGSRLWLATLAFVAALVIAALTLNSCRGDETADATVDREAESLQCPGCNLLLVSFDTLRADRLGCYGYSRPTSPNIDALAAESLVFSNTLAQSPTTTPSHMSIFSGRYVFEHGNSLDTEPVLAELLGNRGYRTAAFVDSVHMSAKLGMTRGYETYFQTQGPLALAGQPTGGLAALNHEIIPWLESHAAERFFVFVHTYDVHCPFTPPEPYLSMFTSGYQPGFEIAGQCGFHFNTLDLGDSDWEYISSLYDGGIRYADAMFEPILKAVRRLGLDQNTIIIVTSDHGESLGERGRVGHNEVRDVQLRVPLIIRHPSGRSAVIDYPAQSIDILPTVLSMLGVEPPGSLPGVDLTQLASSRPQLGRFRLAENVFGTDASVRVDDRWSLLLHWGKPVELYDLRSDPAEASNLIEAEPAIAEKLHAAHKRLRAPVRELSPYPEDLDEETRDQLRALGYTW
jgi:arylsulfatase A-like enzyme